MWSWRSHSRSRWPASGGHDTASWPAMCLYCRWTSTCWRPWPSPTIPSFERSWPADPLQYRLPCFHHRWKQEVKNGPSHGVGPHNLRWHVIHRVVTHSMQIQIARSTRPTWGPPGPVGPRCAPCWPHEPCFQGRDWALYCYCGLAWSQTY